MSNAARIVPLAVIIRWPSSVPAAAGPQQLLLQLKAQRLVSTWAVEQPQQAQAIETSLRGRVEFSTALLLAEIPDSAIAETIDRQLAAFAAAGRDVVALDVGKSLPRGAFERKLCLAGIRALIGREAGPRASSIRTLPFGIWEFGPHIQALAKRRLSLFRRRRTLQQSLDSSPAVASIDLSRVGSMGSRAWRQIEQLVDQAAEAREQGTARILTLSQFAAELSSQSAARPQRSILRSAA